MNEANWKVIPPEELAGMEVGEPVVTFTTEWKSGKRLNHFLEGTFRSYSACRGIVSIDFPRTYSFDNSFCEGSIGRYEIPEPWEVHTDTGNYDE